MSAIALFDIDGTLLRAGGAGRRAVVHAFDEVLGDSRGTAAVESVDFAGRTDRWIVREVLVRCGVAVEGRLVDEVIELYVQRLPVELENAATFEVLPGARDLLEALSVHDGLVLGLGTGNVERAAFAKLRRGRLDSFFGFGGFGCDHEDRARLLEAGLERGRARLQGAHSKVVVVGDTPHDVAAAKEIGAECVAVCTGWYGPEALVAAGATVIVDDLRDARVFEALAG